ncbi:hypothetical protein OQX61_12585 [Pedobacter sp. PLR]|uniref:hypothetical protein n=1 Tax=Pedobacter sp. PLR TaxID=2994465 RepID=UPI002247D978|nr:hypothetical protein [Pedobacter sp. PLR]MCX2452101.1 hypothetical protein [Pedobacter sp. PLR]
MKKLLLSAMACYALTIPARAQDSKNYLYLFSDSVIYAKKIQLRPDFSGYWQFKADSRRVPVDQVKFFNNEDGFFANTRKLSFIGETSFSERVLEGKINLYQERPYDPYMYRRGYSSYGPNRQYPANLSMYYNKGYGDLKRVRYKNLAEDMADHPESMQFLNDYKKSTSLSKIMYVTAGASIIAGFVSILSSGTSFSKGSNFTTGAILMGVGTGLSVSGYMIQLSGTKNIERAVDNYNR